MKNIIKNTLIGAGALSAGIAGGFVLDQPETIEVEKIITKTNTLTEIVEVPVVNTVYENVTVEVPVDNGNLKLVLDHINDNDGRVSYLTSDLKDSEVDEIVDRIVFINEIKKLAVDAVKDEFADEVDRMEVNGVELDEDDIEKLRIDDEDDEIEVEEIDFDDGDAEVRVRGNFEHDDIDYEFSVLVEFKDGEFDELSDIEITED